MASTFTPNLLLENPTPGDPAQKNIWGTTENEGRTLVDSAVAGILDLSVAGNTNVVLTSNSGSADQSRQRRFVFTGALTGNIFVLWPQGRNRFFSVVNNTTGAFTLGCGVNNGAGAPAGTTVNVPQGQTLLLGSDGTNVTVDLSTGTSGALLAINNLSDVNNVATSRTNLGLGTSATHNATDFLLAANNLSDLPSASAARTNLGLGSAATQSTSTFLVATNNLSDLNSASTARANLGLGTAAVQNSGAFFQVANNFSEISNANLCRVNLGLGSAATANASSFLQASNNLSDVSNASVALANIGGVGTSTIGFPQQGICFTVSGGFVTVVSSFGGVGISRTGTGTFQVTLGSTGLHLGYFVGQATNTSSGDSVGISGPTFTMSASGSYTFVMRYTSSKTSTDPEVCLLLFY